MLTELLISICIGICCGIFTGLTPGIHVNLVSVVVLSMSPFLAKYFSLTSLGAMIISMAITHTFLDNLCGTYLGMPDSDQAMNLLPAHRMLKKGNGHSAVVLTLIGSYLSLLLGIVLFPVFLYSMRIMQPLISNIIGYVLIVVVGYMILKERGRKKIFSFFVFLISGFLGIVVLNMPNIEQPMLHLLSGMFGFSLLLLSMIQKSRIPEQKTNAAIELPKKDLIKAVGGATFIGFVAAFLPGFGSSQAAIIAQQMVGKMREEGFLVLVGGINTANTLISIGTAYALGKARNGAIVVVNKLIEAISFETMIIFIIASLIASSIAVIIGLRISRVFCGVVTKVNYNKLVICILCFVVFLSLYFDGFLGFMILAVSTATGLIASYLGVGKNHLMSCLMLPVILFFVG